jgi:hypothetical protein
VSRRPCAIYARTSPFTIMNACIKHSIIKHQRRCIQNEGSFLERLSFVLFLLTNCLDKRHHHIQATRKPLLDKDDKNIEQVDVEQIAIVMKRPPAELQQMLQNVSNSMYPVLTVTLGKAGYDTVELLHYLIALSQHRNFKFLVILREDEEVFAYISGWRAMQILEMDQIEQSQDSFVMAINQRQTKKLMSYGLIKKTVGAKDTNIDALKMMMEMKMDALIVADDDGKLKGVVEREQVLSKLMLAMAETVS